MATQVQHIGSQPSPVRSRGLGGANGGRRWRLSLGPRAFVIYKELASAQRQELTPAHHREADLNLGEPVFTPQSIYTAEFRKIAGYHREPSAPSVAGDQQIVTSDRQALALKARADVG